MSVVPFPGFSLCACGSGIASIPVTGGVVCAECAEAMRTKQVPAADFILVDPDESATLDEVIAKLIGCGQ